MLIVEDPQPGQRYDSEARLVYKPFAGQDDVLNEYESWRKRLARRANG